MAGRQGIRALGAALALFACPLAAAGAETQGSAPEESHSLFWGGLDIGYSSLARSYSVTADTRQNEVTAAFRGGIQMNSRLLVGLEFSGWTIHSGTSPDPYTGAPGSTGELISTRFLILQGYPLAHSELFIRGGGGRVVYTNDQTGQGGATGSGGDVGIGYDVPVHKKILFYVTPSIDYSAGRLWGATSPPGVEQDVHYRALSLRIGLTFR